MKEMGFNFLRKREAERSETGEFNIGEGERDEQRDVDQTKDCSTKQEQKDLKICLQC